MHNLIKAVIIKISRKALIAKKCCGHSIQRLTNFFPKKNLVASVPSFRASMRATWLNTAVAFDPASFAFSPVLSTKDTRTPQRTFIPTKTQSSNCEKEAQKSAPTFTVKEKKSPHRLNDSTARHVTPTN